MISKYIETAVVHVKTGNPTPGYGHHKYTCCFHRSAKHDKCIEALVVEVEAHIGKPREGCASRCRSVRHQQCGAYTNSMVACKPIVTRTKPIEELQQPHPALLAPARSYQSSNFVSEFQIFNANPSVKPVAALNMFRARVAPVSSVVIFFRKWQNAYK